MSTAEFDYDEQSVSWVIYIEFKKEKQDFVIT